MASLGFIFQDTDSGFIDFSDLRNGRKGCAYGLIPLFNECDFDMSGKKVHTISFDEAIERIRKQLKKAFEDTHVQSDRMVDEFKIGTACVSSRPGNSMNSMDPLTWADTSGICKAWDQNRRDGDYDGLIILACVTDDIIPEQIKRIGITHEEYTYALAQSTVYHYLMKKKDAKLKTLKVSTSTTLTYTPNDGFSGSVIYVTYRLQPYGILEDKKASVVTTLDLLRTKLEENEKLKLREVIPNDGNSFFRCCSDQLKRLNLVPMDHIELRQKVAKELETYSDDEITAANFTKGEWSKLLQDIIKDGGHIESIVEKAMAEALQRKIIIYSLSYSSDLLKRIVNESAKKAPLLLAKDENIYKSLQPIQSSTKSKKRPAATTDNDDIPETKHIKENEIEPSTHIPNSVAPTSSRVDVNVRIGVAAGSGNSADVDVNPPSPSPAKDDTPKKQNTKKMTKDEKMLILQCYIEQSVKTDFDKLADVVYKARRDKLSKEIWEHYEQNLNKETTLKQRIKGYIQRCQRNKVDEKDPDIQYLMRKANFS